MPSKEELLAKALRDNKTETLRMALDRGSEMPSPQDLRQKKFDDRTQWEWDQQRKNDRKQEEDRKRAR